MMDFSNLEEFHCSICDRLFDSNERCPKMLSCGHSFCLACLNKIFPYSPSCPTCRTDIQYPSVDMIPVNLLIKSCVSKINVKSGVKRKDIAEQGEASNSTSTEFDAKRKKLVNVGFCDEHENFKEFRCMNCDAWICSMCATLNHKKCNTLLIEDAFNEIQKKSDQMIANQLDIRKSRLAIIFKSLKAVEDKKDLLEQDIQDLKLKIEAKLAEIKEQDIEFEKFQNIIVEEKKMCVKLKEIQLLTKSSLCEENLQKLLEAKLELDTLCQQSKSDQKHIYSISEQEIKPDIKDSNFVPKKVDSSASMVVDEFTTWNRGRVLMVGDSIIQHMMDTPDPVLSLNVDCHFKSLIETKDLIVMVDKLLSDDHNIIIIMGFIGDAVQIYDQSIAKHSSVKILVSKECNPTDGIFDAIREAHNRWMAMKPDRIIIWTLPYYINFPLYNREILKKDNFYGKPLGLSFTAGEKFVQFNKKMEYQWRRYLPNIPFQHCNEVLFHGSGRSNIGIDLMSTFESTNSRDFRFPTKFLLDGLHPSKLLVPELWSFLKSCVYYEGRVRALKSKN